MNSIFKAATLNRSTFPLLWHQNLTEVGDFAHFFRHSPSKMRAKSHLISFPFCKPATHSLCSLHWALTINSVCWVSHCLVILTPDIGPNIHFIAATYTNEKKLHLSMGRSNELKIILKSPLVDWLQLRMFVHPWHFDISNAQLTIALSPSHKRKSAWI